MNAQSPGAYVLSAIVHATAVALLLCVAYVMRQNLREPAKVIELVAGDGDNWAATEAPALGTPEGKEILKMPEIPMTAAAPMPRISEPEPVAQPESKPIVEPEPVPAKPAPVKKVEPAPAAKPSPLDQKKTTFTQDVKRIADKREARRMKEYRAKQAQEAARAKKEAMMSKADFDRMQTGKGTSKGKIQRIDAKGIAGGVPGGSTANTKGGAGGKALTAEGSSQLDRYFEFLKREIKKSHVAPPGITDLTTTVQFIVGADGKISGVRVVRSSGNGEFDQSVLEAIRRTPSVGMRPDGNTDAVEMEFSARDD